MVVVKLSNHNFDKNTLEKYEKNSKKALLKPRFQHHTRTCFSRSFNMGDHSQSLEHRTKTISCKNAAKNATTNNFFPPFGGAKLKFFIDFFLISFALLVLFFVLTDFEDFESVKIFFLLSLNFSSIREFTKAITRFESSFLKDGYQNDY